MDDKEKDLLSGELESDADLDPNAEEHQADTGEGYTDPVEQDLEAVLPQGHPAAEPGQLP